MSSVESMSNRPPVLCCAVCCCMLRSAWFNATRSVAACAEVCCNDWSCWGFAFYPKGKTGNNTAKWPKIDLHKHATPGHPKRIVDCANASQAAGMECKGDNLSPLGNFCDDPTQPCCALLSDSQDLLVPATVPGARTGIRGRLPARDPERGRYEHSSIIKTIHFDDQLYTGNWENRLSFPVISHTRRSFCQDRLGTSKGNAEGNVISAGGMSVYPKAHGSSWDLGDEFPTSWSDDGYQYSGAGDNSASGYPGSDSPLTMWRIRGADPPSAVFSLTGNHTPVSVPGLCPITKSGVPNLKSQSVFAIGRIIYWAIACFDYDDPDIGR